jgi:peptidoglycan/LPS O-acetylase OafA/YrhL
MPVVIFTRLDLSRQISGVAVREVRSTADPSVRHRLRPDIQGLRAFAVLAVVANHLFEFPVGGFVGVDIFFVISGFLITGLMLRERERSGRISIADFYRRRIKRILPGALVVLLVTVSTAWLIFRPGRAITTTIDAIWALCFSANWRFAIIGTDYLQAAGPLSPVQHFWSLGVEEQFYLVWPWILILVAVVLARVRTWSLRTTKIMLFGALALVTIASFIFAIWETRTAGTVAYFSTFARGWELGAGALLAVLSRQLRRPPDVARPIMAWIGVAGLVWSVFFITPALPFPAPWGAIPVVATCAVIAAGEGGEQRFLWPLTNRGAGYVGRISYSLYLWHFPVIVVLGTVMVPRGIRFTGLCLALMFALSVASFHLLEEPIRRSRWLTSRGSRSATPLALDSTRGRWTEARLVGSGVLAIAIVALASFGIAQVLAPIPPVPVAARAVSSAAASRTQASLTADIASALDTTSWPALTPSLDSLSGQSSLAPEWVVDNCLDTSATTLSRCSYGNPKAEYSAVLLGDSVAMSWMPALRSALGSKDWNIHSLTLGECPAIEVSATRYLADGANDTAFEKKCAAHHSWVIRQVKRLHPDLVIVASAESTLQRLSDGDTGQAAFSEWQAGTTRTLEALHAATAGRIVLLSSPPTVRDVKQCATNFNSPSDCISSVDVLYRPMILAERAAVADVASPADVIQVETLPWFCNDERCPSFVEDIPTYDDSTHITAAYSHVLAPLLRSALSR